MIKLEMKCCSMILIQKKQKYQHDRLEKEEYLDKQQYVTGGEILSFIQR